VKDFTLKMHSIFGNTCMCESTFSTMKQVKYKTEIKGRQNTRR